MAVIDRIDINKKRSVPAWTKMILLLLVVFGIYMRSCWNKQQKELILIQNPMVDSFNSASVDVVFDVINRTSRAMEKKILIRVYSEEGEEIASKITLIKIQPSSNKRFLKVLQKINRPIRDESDVAKATVELYVSSIID